MELKHKRHLRPHHWKSPESCISIKRRREEYTQRYFTAVSVKEALQSLVDGEKIVTFDYLYFIKVT